MNYIGGDLKMENEDADIPVDPTEAAEVLRGSGVEILSNAFRELQNANLRALTEGRGLGNNTETMIDFLNRKLGYSNLVEQLARCNREIAALRAPRNRTEVEWRDRERELLAVNVSMRERMREYEDQVEGFQLYVDVSGKRLDAALEREGVTYEACLGIARVALANVCYLAGDRIYRNGWERAAQNIIQGIMEHRAAALRSAVQSPELQPAPNDGAQG